MTACGYTDDIVGVSSQPQYGEPRRVTIVTRHLLVCTTIGDQPKKGLPSGVLDLVN